MDKTEIQYKASEIKASRKKALEKIILILDKGDIEKQFEGRSGEYHSKEKFIVTWAGNYKGMPSEMALCLTDAFYKNYSGYACIHSNTGLFHEKQIAGYPTIEYGLIAIAMKLAATREKKEDIFNKYAKPYNQRLKEKKQQ